MKNNIFDFATGELSQDAFLCWCANWFRDTDAETNPRLRQMALEFIRLLLDDPKKEITSVEIRRQFSTKVYVSKEDNEDKAGDEEKIEIKIDVLFIVNQTIAVILEDKKGSSEHDDQIARYKKGLIALKEKGKEEEKALLANVTDVYTVFLKTGFHYDIDQCVKADCKIDGVKFLHFLQPYAGCSEILDSYIAKLEADLAWDEEHGAYAQNLQEPSWKWDVVNHHIAQYRLMRDVFPEEKWVDRESGEYYVYHGSSPAGSPYTQMEIPSDWIKGKNKSCVFWRIDSAKESRPYISLRYYDRYTKKDEVQKERHRTEYNHLKTKIQGIVDGNSDVFPFAYQKVNPGKRENYMEADLFNLDLTEWLLHWESEGASVIKMLRFLTDEFVKEEPLTE